MKVLDPFEIEDSLESDSLEPLFKSAGDGRDYTWNGQRFPRVTWYLDQIASPHLMGWAGKMGALSAARPLIASGLYTPQACPGGGIEYDAMDSLVDVPSQESAMDYETQAELEKYFDSEAMQIVDSHDALAMACDWRFHMKAQYRYRDHKGRIGSVGHFYKHNLALGLVTAPTIEMLAELAYNKIAWPDDLLDRYAGYGKSKDDLSLDLAFHAMPHARNVFDFVELYRPEYEFSGLEACVISRLNLHAGTLDDWAIYDQARWREINSGRWPFDPAVRKARLIGDLKTSNLLKFEVRFQMAAYAKSDFVGLFADHTEQAMPEFDGMLALHSRPEEGMSIVPFGRHHIEPAYDAFCDLAKFVRARHNMPRVSRGRQEKTAPKGQRENPIFVGGKR